MPNNQNFDYPTPDHEILKFLVCLSNIRIKPSEYWYIGSTEYQEHLSWSKKSAIFEILRSWIYSDFQRVWQQWIILKTSYSLQYARFFLYINKIKVFHHISFQFYMYKYWKLLFFLIFSYFFIKNKEKYQFSIYLQLKLIKIIIKHFFLLI